MTTSTMGFAPAERFAGRVRVGDVLADKCEVTKLLGQGGMGVVVAARHRELDKLVALKFMHEEVAQNEHATDRFLREARAAARLQSEHIARVLDVGRSSTGTPYIVMEYLEGYDLAVVGERGQIDVADVCEYVLQACEALAEAHAQGIVHRDLKPQNLFLTLRQDGRPLVKVLDFGISKAQCAQGPTATQSMMGSPAYMSPEQIKSARSVDARADIWSLGVILYQLLAGRLPFPGETVTETLLKVITDPLPPLAELRPGLPPALVGAIERCLEKDRDRRFGSVAELSHELTPFAPERARVAMSLIERVMSAGAQQLEQRRTECVATDAATPSIAPSQPAVVQTTLGAAASQSVDHESRSLGRRWLAGFATVIVAVGIALLVTRNGGDEEALAIQPSNTSSFDAGAAVLDAITPTLDARVETIVVDAMTPSPADAPEPRGGSRPKSNVYLDPKHIAPDAGADLSPDAGADLSPDAREYKPVEEPERKPVGEKQ